ncbi:dihydropteroate synthase [Desulfosediminicola ganghwensis]|uniref:dihydropteroate synthase n=1 Tax=Desulfosediminicola ganghwensis TaxID=2569540 RepID=UPI0010AD3351|nr:dihydropteroate synthase [Desulfosediminicola ganghwensis]
MRTIRTRIMGILNVTPDSFSDGGSFDSIDKAVHHATELIEAGADILDVGGESTRPYAEPVSLQDELARTIPVIKAVRELHSTPISIDTTKAEVARQALAAGANIINDISALNHDPEMIEVVQETDAPVVIMHMQGTPADMQDRPEYQDIISDILTFFEKRIEWMVANNVDRKRIIVDPGIGFGKTLSHNLAIIRHLDRFRTLGQQVLLGHSRKSFLGLLTGMEAEQRDLSTAVVSALAVQSRIDIIRVHNVEATRQALQIAEAIHPEQ